MTRPQQNFSESDSCDKVDHFDYFDDLEYFENSEKPNRFVGYSFY